MLTLQGCSTAKGVKQVRANIEDPPANIVGCFNSVVKVPHRELRAKEMARLIDAMRRAELDKNACGRQLLAWAADVQRDNAPKTRP